MLTADGALTNYYGQWRQPLQFKSPWDVDHNGKVFVTEYANNPVQLTSATRTASVAKEFNLEILDIDME